MNREQKRMMQRQGQMQADGTAGTRRTSVEDVQRRRSSERTKPRDFFRQVREEMRQVAWPLRPEVVNYTTIVLFVLIFMTALIFGLGVGSEKFVSFMFTK